MLFVLFKLIYNDELIADPINDSFVIYFNKKFKKKKAFLLFSIFNRYMNWHPELFCYVKRLS